MILKFYSHVSDTRQKIPHGLILVPRPGVMGVSLNRCFLGRGVACGVLGLTSVNDKVFLQLLCIDIM